MTVARRPRTSGDASLANASAPPQRVLPPWLVHHSHAGASAACDLSPIADSVHLIAFLYAPTVLLNRHFIAHYVRLGVAPARMRIFLELGDHQPPRIDAGLLHPALRGSARRRVSVADVEMQNVSILSHFPG